MSDLAERMGRVFGQSEQTILFHALRMMFEVVRGRRLTVPEQKRLFNKAQWWTPEREY